MVHILMLFPSAILFQKSSRPVTYGKTAGFFLLMASFRIVFESRDGYICKLSKEPKQLLPCKLIYERIPARTETIRFTIQEIPLGKCRHEYPFSDIQHLLLFPYHTDAEDPFPYDGQGLLFHPH